MDESPNIRGYAQQTGQWIVFAAVLFSVGYVIDGLWQWLAYGASGSVVLMSVYRVIKQRQMLRDVPENTSD